MAHKHYSVYYLLDPTSQQVRYVGYSCRPSARFRDHLQDTRTSHKARWIAKLRVSGLTPILSVKCVVQTHAEACRVEIALIAYLRAHGARLTNETSGGSGASDLSVEASARKTAAGIRRYSDPSERQKTREATLRAWADPVSKAKRVAGILQSWDDPARRVDAATHTQTSWNDPQVREARSSGISQAKRGIPQSKAHRAALIAVRSTEAVRAKHRKPHSEAWKQNIKDGWARRTAAGIPRSPRSPWTPERRAKVAAAWAAKRLVVTA